MLTDSYLQNQDQSSFQAHLSSKTTYEHSRKFEFINESPPIDEKLSKYLEEKLIEYEKQERANAKEKARYEKAHPEKKKRRRRSDKAENRHKLIYTAKLFDIAYVKSNPARRTVSNIAGVHVNTFDNHKRELKAMGYFDWDSGKKTWETNTYYLPDHVKLQTITRPKDFAIPRFLFLAIQRVLKKLNWADQQTIYKQLIKDLVHHETLRVRKKRTSLDENEKKSSKDPPKSRDGPRSGRKKPKRPIFRQLLAEFKLSFRDQAILSSYGEAPLRTAINELQSYSGKVLNTVAFLISRCKVIKSKLQDMAKEVYASAEENLNWLKKKLSDEKLKKKIILKSGDAIDRTSQGKKPYVELLIHKSSPEKSKFIINQKVNGYWIDKIIPITREKFRTAVMETLELSLKYAQGSQSFNKKA